MVGENLFSIQQLTRYHKNVFKAEICERVLFSYFIQFELSLKPHLPISTTARVQCKINQLPAGKRPEITIWNVRFF